MCWIPLLLWACCALSRAASATAKGGSSVRYVDDEEAFIAAVKSGSTIIVVRKHLDLWCNRYDNETEWLREEADGTQCDSTDFPWELPLQPSTRAIVVSNRFVPVCGKFWKHLFLQSQQSQM
jgi:hypothetical protein